MRPTVEYQSDNSRARNLILSQAASIRVRARIRFDSNRLRAIAIIIGGRDFNRERRAFASLDRLDASLPPSRQATRRKKREERKNALHTWEGVDRDQQRRLSALIEDTSALLQLRNRRLQRYE